MWPTSPRPSRSCSGEGWRPYEVKSRSGCSSYQAARQRRGAGRATRASRRRALRRRGLPRAENGPDPRGRQVPTASAEALDRRKQVLSTSERRRDDNESGCAAESRHWSARRCKPPARRSESAKRAAPCATSTATPTSSSRGRAVVRDWWANRAALSSQGSVATFREMACCQARRAPSAAARRWATCS